MAFHLQAHPQLRALVLEDEADQAAAIEILDVLEDDPAVAAGVDPHDPAGAGYRQLTRLQLELEVHGIADPEHAGAREQEAAAADVDRAGVDLGELGAAEHE